MARISTYNLDPNLQELDKVIGTDATDRGTKNFNLRQLGDFYTRTGIADATRLGFRFDVQGVNSTDGLIANPDLIIEMGSYFEFSSGRSFSNITRVIVAPRDLDDFSFAVLEGILTNGRCKIVTTRQRGQTIRGQGYFNVSNFVQLEGSGGVIRGYQLDLNTTNLGAGQEGDLQFGPGITEPDESIIIVPLSPTEANVTGADHVFRNIVVTGSGTITADGLEDTLTIQHNSGIELTGVDNTPNPGGTLNIDHANTGPDTPLTTNTGQNFIQNITLDSFGHISNVTVAEAMGSATPALPRNFNISGASSYASGALNSNIYVLTGQTGFTITNLVWSLVSPPTGVTINSSTGVVTDSDTTNRTGTYMVRATFDYEQTDLDTNTGTGEVVNHGVRIFAPYYSGIQTTVPANPVPNSSLTRAVVELTSGGIVPFNSGAGVQEGILNLRDADFASPTFRTGGFLIITPEARLNDGGDYTTYVFSLTPNSRLDLEVL
ncbi:MAG: hypothetical protein MPJ25_10575 [Pirellulales bacterium]|nr:hypothetical protein [Pirellulales bacterium]